MQGLLLGCHVWLGYNERGIPEIRICIFYCSRQVDHCKGPRKRRGGQWWHAKAYQIWAWKCRTWFGWCIGWIQEGGSYFWAGPRPCSKGEVTWYWGEVVTWTFVKALDSRIEAFKKEQDHGRSQKAEGGFASVC